MDTMSDASSCNSNDLMYTNGDGIVRMRSKWRQKLWIDFDRDEHFGPVEIEDDEKLDLSVINTRELSLNNRTCTEQNLCYVRDNIKNYDEFLDARVPLEQLELSKVLFSNNKTQILKEAFELPTCQIKQAFFDHCRAKTQQMSMIIDALSMGKKIIHLQFQNMNFPRDSMQSLAQLIKENPTLQMLELLNTGLTDNTVQILAEGIKKSESLVYLDVRQNSYENDGAMALLKSLIGKKTFITLRINAIQFQLASIKALETLFSHPDCRIQDLEMEELEIPIDLVGTVIDTVRNLACLYTFDYSNNTLPQPMLESIVQMTNKYHMLEILCLDHCEMTDEACAALLPNMQNSQLVFLNISWNFLTGKSIDALIEFVKQNHGLKKLALQHNRFGEYDAADQAIHDAARDEAEKAGNFTKHKKRPKQTGQQNYYGKVSQNSFFNRKSVIFVFFPFQKTIEKPKKHVRPDFTEFAYTIQEHHFLEYLDISQNYLSNRQFRKIFEAVQHEHSNVKTFCCRKNQVGGRHITWAFQTRCLNLELIDLQRNNLTEENASAILTLATQNVNIRCIKLQNNVLLNAQLLMQIDEQCRQNNFIKDKIVPFQPGASKELQQSRDPSNIYSQYDNSSVVLKHQRLDHIDFIQKFVAQNCSECTRLILIDLDLSRCQGQMTKILSRSNDFLINIKILHIQDIKFGPKPTHKLVQLLHKLKQLEELALVNLESLEEQGCMAKLAKSIKHHKFLRILDLRQENLRTRKVDDLIALLSTNKTILKLDISKAIVSLKNMTHLWAAMHKNSSVCELIYSRYNFFAIKEMQAVDIELKLNKIIRDEIIPVISHNSQDSTHLSFSGLNVDSQKSPAVLKFIKVQPKIQHLDVSNTALSKRDLNELIILIIKMNLKLKSLNLSHCSSVDDEVIRYLSPYTEKNRALEELLLDKTSITMDSLMQIFKTIKESLRVRTISVKDNDIRFTGSTDQVAMSLRENISVTKFGYSGNNYGYAFEESIESELRLNKKISECIFPQLKKQEIETRDRLQEQNKTKRRNAVEINTKNDGLKKLKRKNFKSLDTVEQIVQKYESDGQTDEQDQIMNQDKSRYNPRQMERFRQNRLTVSERRSRAANQLHFKDPSHKSNINIQGYMSDQADEILEEDGEYDSALEGEQKINSSSSKQDDSKQFKDFPKKSARNQVKLLLNNSGDNIVEDERRKPSGGEILNGQDSFISCQDMKESPLGQDKAVRLSAKLKRNAISMPIQRLTSRIQYEETHKDGWQLRRQAIFKMQSAESSADSSDQSDDVVSSNLSSSSQDNDDDDSQSDVSSDNSADDFKQVHKSAGFRLVWQKNSLVEIDPIKYITKFMRVFKRIEQIDFKDVKIGDEELIDFCQELTRNRFVQQLNYKNHKGITKEMNKELEREIRFNKAIKELCIDDTSGTTLQLQNLKDLSFLPKMIQDFTQLKELDLSDSDLRETENIKHLCKMIDSNDTLENLILQRCMLNGRGLGILANSLTKSDNKDVCKLDIRENPIEDQQYKVLFGLLQNNGTLLEIKYSLNEEENKEALSGFQKAVTSKVLAQTMRNLKEKDEIIDTHMHHHHHEIPCWQKVCFPIWLWKSLIHDKHEAFRFKYDTKAIKTLEATLMKGIKRDLYLWSFVYYALTFIAPYIFIAQECEKTFEPMLFYLYGAYLFLSGVWEIYKVVQIQKLLAKPNLLQFNKWHVVELFMGSIARTDTFLDICFIHIIGNCWEEHIHWLIPSSIFAVINMLFPTIMLLRLLKTDSGSSLVQPNLESACFVSFIRENMLLATVLDSFCIDNAYYFMGKPLVFGKLMGFISFFTQDAPQLTIHVMFKLVIFNESQKKLKTQTLLLVGMIVSSCAVLISLFNMVMCSQNEFNPITLEQELRLRRGERKLSESGSDDNDDDDDEVVEIQTAEKVVKKDAELLSNLFKLGLANHLQQSIVKNGENEMPNKVPDEHVQILLQPEKQLTFADKIREHNLKVMDQETTKKLDAFLVYYSTTTNTTTTPSDLNRQVLASSDNNQAVGNQLLVVEEEQQETERRLITASSKDKLMPSIENDNAAFKALDKMAQISSEPHFCNQTDEGNGPLIYETRKFKSIPFSVTRREAESKIYGQNEAVVDEEMMPQTSSHMAPGNFRDTRQAMKMPLSKPRSQLLPDIQKSESREFDAIPTYE